MTEQILLPPDKDVARIFWKPWKWAGLAVYALALVFRRNLPVAVFDLACIYGIVVIANVLFAGFRYLRNRLFWRVRNRLIGSFIFVGVIPILILLGIVSISGYLLFAQMASQYLDDALRQNNHLVTEINLEMAGQIRSPDSAPLFAAKAATVFASHSAQFPSLSSRLLRRTAKGDFEVVAKYDPQSILPDTSTHPGAGWLGAARSFEDILGDGRSILLTSLRPVPGLAGIYLEISAPLESSMEDRLRREKSLYVNFVPEENAHISTGEKGVRITMPKEEGQESASKAAESRANQDQMMQDSYRKQDSRKMLLWIPTISGKSYGSGESAEVGKAVLFVPWSVILANYIGEDISQSVLLKIVYVLTVVFALVALISIFIGFTISRRVTGSVHDLYQGILALQKGNLQHRVAVRRKDQLGLLAHSFNQMTGSISRLMEEVVEKKRLEKELEIAREVQASLFPKHLPHPPGMAVFGGCKPARVVSGDYYDFVVEDETHLNIIVGDISGKGISAALLMANLQAAMRTQLLSGKHDDKEAVGKSLAEVMMQLNRQIYLNSPPEKYATLFLSRYDANSRRLWYCNAGHLPPVVLGREGARTLDATGTVIGLFPNAEYEAKSIDLPPGTVLAIYTDGITEAVNKEDEEFGEKRLLEALQQRRTRTPESIWQDLTDTVAAWQGDLPQHDDITLIVAKTT